MSFNFAARQAATNIGALSVAVATLGTVWAASSTTKTSRSEKTNKTESSISEGERVAEGVLRDRTGTWKGHSPSLVFSGDVSRVACSAAVSNGDSSSAQIQQSNSTTTSSSNNNTKHNNNNNSKVMAPSLLGEQPNHNPESSSSSSGFLLRKRSTLARLNKYSTKETLVSKYEVNPDPIGEGAFGQVFVARDRATGEMVAVKKIWKEFSDNQDFVREMSTLLQIRAHGGHPHICQLKENFDEEENYALVLDLIKGGEMFDHLVESGAYSELDASRLIREVASALAFMHGIGLVHCDLKPENLMLSSKTDSASIKIVDFGCTEHLSGFGGPITKSVLDIMGPVIEQRPKRSSGGTVAYSPPESFDSDSPVDPSLDMWALGIILHIMLTGIHPFDPTGDADDETLQRRISVMKRPPLDTPDTEHLSPSAMDLLRRLLEPDPSKRLKAHEMLEHSWVRGDTARVDVIEDSDQKLSKYRKFRSKIETQVFQELMSWSENKNRLDPSQNGESLVEKAFKSLDKEAKGFLTMDDIPKEQGGDADEAKEENVTMTFSGFSDLLGENMQNRYFPAGHVIFHEGDPGKYMYFLNSGTCEVITKDGFHHILKHGDTFGEGGLINEAAKRSATIKTITPVHALQIDRNCFAKYLLGSDSALALKIKERVNKRRFARAEYIIGRQEDLVVHNTTEGGKIYSDGDKADSIFYVVEGTIDVRNNGHTVYHANAGELLGVQSFYFNRSRDADAVCRTDRCSVKAMNAVQFKELAANMPELKSALHELALRREFQRAIVRKLKTSFSTMDLRQVFDEIDLDKTGLLNRDELRDLLTHLDVAISEEELIMLVETLDLDSTGFINFQEFTTLFA